MLDLMCLFPLRVLTVTRPHLALVLFPDIYHKGDDLESCDMLFCFLQCYIIVVVPCRASGKTILVRA